MKLRADDLKVIRILQKNESERFTTFKLCQKLHGEFRNTTSYRNHIDHIDVLLNHLLKLCIVKRDINTRYIYETKWWWDSDCTMSFTTFFDVWLNQEEL